MEIIYENQHSFSKDELQRLFRSVNWASGEYPEKLVDAMKNYSTVFAARDNGNLIGLISVMDDKTMTAYIHYLLVDPKYQGLGIGKRLVDKIKDAYKDYLRIALVSYKKEVGFYESCGFKISDDLVPMSITELYN